MGIIPDKIINLQVEKGTVLGNFKSKLIAKSNLFGDALDEAAER